MPPDAHHEDAVAEYITVDEPADAQSMLTGELYAMLAPVREFVIQPSGSASVFSGPSHYCSWWSRSEIYNPVTNTIVPVDSSKYTKQTTRKLSDWLDADAIKSCRRLAKELYRKGVRVELYGGLANEAKINEYCIATAAGHLWLAVKESAGGGFDNKTVEKEVWTLIKHDSKQDDPWLDTWIVPDDMDWAMEQTE